MIHLTCGSTGAGKTTYSRTLAHELGGVVFSIDEWMVSLFGDDAPKDMNPGWFMPRVERCEQQIRSVILQLAALGTPSVLDLGFQRLEHRQAYTAFAEESGLPFELHFLDTAADVRWSRVDSRNKEQGATYKLNITRSMFDYIETVWEPPTPSEMSASQGKRITA